VIWNEPSFLANNSLPFLVRIASITTDVLLKYAMFLVCFSFYKYIEIRNRYWFEFACIDNNCACTWACIVLILASTLGFILLGIKNP